MRYGAEGGTMDRVFRRVLDVTSLDAAGYRTRTFHTSDHWVIFVDC